MRRLPYQMYGVVPLFIARSRSRHSRRKNAQSLRRVTDQASGQPIQESRG
jgi:hypothetical protein